MEPKPNKEQNNKLIGNQGEHLTAKYYIELGFELVSMNYRQKWGELDVIVKKDNRIHFIEVKTVSYETKHDLERAVLHGTYRPEENVHHSKLHKLAKAIETWIFDKKWEGDWQIDVAAVRIVPRETYGTINIIENVIID